MKRLIEEPLFHFLLLGAGLFVAYSAVTERDESGRDRIVVSAGKIEHMAALFTRTWQRPPTRAELDGLVDDYVREEVAYREGTAMGLDRDDTVVRRRIRQKLDFFAQDVASLTESTEDELQAYLAAHAESFRIDPRVSFRHVYFDSRRRGDALEADVRELLARLDEDPTIDAGQLGDRILLEHGYQDVHAHEIANLLGERFAAAIVELTPGEWHGPVESGYGVHAVIVDERVEGRVPKLEEVRDLVRREWENERREATIDRFYEELLGKHDIEVQWPAPADRDP